MWHMPAPGSGEPSNTPTPARQASQTQGLKRSDGYYSLPSQPGDKACQAFNRGAHIDNSFHPLDLHICEHCLNKVQRLCKYTLCLRQITPSKCKEPGYPQLVTDLGHSQQGHVTNDMDLDNKHTSCHLPRPMALWQLPAPPLSILWVAPAAPLSCTLHTQHGLGAASVAARTRAPLFRPWPGILAPLYTAILPSTNLTSRAGHDSMW